MGFEETDPELEGCATAVVNGAFLVHKTFGPGLLESAYEACLFHELSKKGLKVERQVAIPLVYDGKAIDVAYRADLVVQDKLIVELKAVEKILPIHEAQMITYLKSPGNDWVCWLISMFC
jgi:GxxExxY protein